MNDWIKNSVMTAVILIVFVLIWEVMLGKPAKAQTYNEAVLGHVITENIRGGIDNEAVMEAEMQRAAYMFAIQSINILESYLPAILDGVKRDMEIQVEEKYKNVIKVMYLALLILLSITFLLSMFSRVQSHHLIHK